MRKATVYKEIDKYLREHPEIREFLEIWNISKKEYEKAIRELDKNNNYPLANYSVNS